MVDILERPTKDFGDAAAQPAKATLEIDSDLADYLKSQFPDGWQAHANDLLRFFMDTSQAKEREFAHIAQQEPDETAAPALTPI
jgi:hypothetical protein